MSLAPWSPAEFEAELRLQGKAYHIHHPFNVLLNSGGASREQIQGWVANRFYYQISIPIKDAAILANCPDRSVRRHWVQRILDHDGYGDDAGGIDSWLRLGEAVGLERSAIESLDDVLPGVRFAVDAYVNFARRAPWPEAVCSSLTELFAPEIHKQRLANWPEHYPWIDPAGLHYFQSRVSLARRDVEFGLAVTLRHFTTRALQERALEILRFKLNVLWQMSDAMAIRFRVAVVTAPLIDAHARPRIERRFRLQWEAAQDAYVLLYPEGMIKLNSSAGEILKRCNGTATIGEITADLERAFETTGLSGDVIAFATMAMDKNWLVIAP